MSQIIKNLNANDKHCNVILKIIISFFNVVFE